MNMLEEIYHERCNAGSDISDHLPTLYKYSIGLDHITEMGFRKGVSIYAFAMGKPKTLVTWDNQIRDYADFDLIEQVCMSNGIQFIFNHKDTLKDDSVPTDLLFIDTEHHYGQLRTELQRHGNNARKYIIMHDTETYGEISDNNSRPGLNKAIEEFMIENPHWVVKEVFKNNNGLTILERK